MRTAVYNLKFATALKKVNNIQHPSSPCPANHEPNQPLISVINLDCFNPQDISGQGAARKVKLLATVSIPHARNQQKVLKFLVQNNKISQDGQEWTAKLKSERIRSLTLKHKSEQSERIQLDSNSQHATLPQSQVPEQHRPKIRLQNAVIIDRIGTLRKKQRVSGCRDEQYLLNEVFAGESRAKTSQPLFQQNQVAELLDNRRRKREQALDQLKLHINNKITKRHNYNNLKQKQELHTELKLRNQSKYTSSSAEPTHRGDEEYLQQNQKKGRTKLKNIELRAFKSYNRPLLAQSQYLKVDSRPAQIVCDILKCKQQYMRNSINKLHKTLRIVNKNRRADHPDHSLCSPEMRRQQLRQSRFKLCRQYSTQGREGIMKRAQEASNEFRQLTPWHDNIDY